MIDLSKKPTQAEFGALVGITQPAVSSLVKAQVLTEGADCGTWLLEYCRNLRETAAGRAAAGDVDLATERAKLARAQRERIEMANAVTRKELAPAYLIEEVLAKAGAKAGKILDTIPGLIRRRAPEIPAAALAAVQSAVAEARNVAASVSLADLEDDESVPAADAADVCTVEDGQIGEGAE